MNKHLSYVVLTGCCMALMGCTQHDPTCPMPQDGVCAAIHDIDQVFTLKQQGHVMEDRV